MVRSKAAPNIAEHTFRHFDGRVPLRVSEPSPKTHRRRAAPVQLSKVRHPQMYQVD